MLRLFNPWMILAAILALGGAFGYGAHIGYEHSQNGYAKEAAKQLSLEEKIQQTLAAEVSKIRVTNTTIKQTIEGKTRESIVYRECRAGDDVGRLLDSALEGKSAPVPAGGGVVPAPDKTP